MQKKRNMAGFIALLCLMIGIAGCGNNGDNDSPAASPEAASPSSASESSASASDASAIDASEEVELKIVLPGSKPANYDSVKAAVEKKLAEDGQNTKLDITYVDWGDLDQKTKVMLASGEKIDLIYDAPWLHLNQMIATGYYEDIGDLLEKYGTNVVSTRSQEVWDANKFNGKIMGVPLGIFLTQGHSYSIRKDLREAVGMEPIKTHEDFVKYLYAVKAKFPDITPYFPRSDDTSYSWLNWLMKDDTASQIRPTSIFGNSLVLYHKGNDGKVYNLFEDTDPVLWGHIQEARKLFDDGIFSPDLLTTKADSRTEFTQNKYAALPVNLFGPNMSKEQIQQTIPGAEVEAVRFFDLTPGKNVSNFAMDNFIAIPKISKNKERAMMFLDWANQKDNYMLVEHGVEGVDYEAVGENRFKQLVVGQDENGGGLGSFSLVWNPVHEKTIDTTDDETMKYQNFIKDSNNFTKDILTGFTFDATPVKNEIAQFSTIQTKYYAGIVNGAFDPDKYFADFKKEGSATLKTIQTELQKQIDAFLANK